MSETLTLFGAALTMLLAYRFRDRPTRARAVALGLSCVLLAITHAEQLLLVVVLLIPLILLARDVPRRRRVGWALLATTAAVVVVLPWAAYNTARFHKPVLLGNQFGVTVAISGPAAGSDHGTRRHDARRPIPPRRRRLRAQSHLSRTSRRRHA